MDSKLHQGGGTSLIKINLPSKGLGSKNASLNISKLTEGAAAGQDRSFKADSAVRAFEMAQRFEREREDSKKQHVTLESFMDEDEEEEEKQRNRDSFLESKGKIKPLVVKKGPFPAP